MPVALNVGDYLLGEGYRLLAECDATSDVRAQMLRVAALGHRQLCLGQGAELSWCREPAPLKSLEVLEIHRQKTSPAFEVALRLGAILAGGEKPILGLLKSFSRSLGLAYQIRDDLEDLQGESEVSDISRGRPTLPLAVGYERAKGRDKELLDAVWRGQAAEKIDATSLVERLESMGALERCRELSEAYKEEAIRALWDLDNPNLKGLLRRVIGKIFNDTQIKGWCNEFETRNAAGREVGTPAVG